jgi:hypothetical protein
MLGESCHTVASEEKPRHGILSIREVEEPTFDFRVMQVPQAFVLDWTSISAVSIIMSLMEHVQI